MTPESVAEAARLLATVRLSSEEIRKYKALRKVTMYFSGYIARDADDPEVVAAISEILCNREISRREHALDELAVLGVDVSELRQQIEQTESMRSEAFDIFVAS